MFKTQRLTLRGPQADDAEDLFDVFGRADAMRYWSTPPHASVHETGLLLEDIARSGPPRTYFVVAHGGRAVGTAGFWRGDEVGFILHPDLWRQGYGEEVLRALVVYGFETLGLRQITADVDPRNGASIGLLGKLGFSQTGTAERTVKIGDVWYDSIYFALRRPDSQP